MAGTLLIDEHNSGAVDNDVGDKFICHCAMMGNTLLASGGGGGAIIKLNKLTQCFSGIEEGVNKIILEREKE